MTKTLSFALFAALIASSAVAQTMRGPALLPAQAGDLVPAHIVAAERIAAPDIERAPVSFYQPLSADEPLAQAAPHAAQSREYWQRVTASQLRQGYALALTAPGAVVLLSPGARAEPLRHAQVGIRSGGARLALSQAADTLVDAAALQAAGMDVRAGSVGFRLRDGFENDAALQVDGAQGEYVLHVLEPLSPHVLSVQGAADSVHAGDEVEVNLALAGGAALDSAAGLLVAPDGRSFDLAFADAGGAASAGRVRVPSDIRAQPGLWEVRTTVAGSDGMRAFQRDARTAIAVVAPTARLDGTVAIRRDRVDGAWSIAFGVDVASAGRYEVRGVVYGAGKGGALVPIGIAHSAAWLDAGRGRLSLSLPVAVSAAAEAPLELRDLRLIDQSALGLLERRERALIIY